MKNLFLPFLLPLMLVLLGNGSTSSEDAISHSFINYQKHNSQEKLYLHFDKHFYASGETIWFKVYLRDLGDLSPSDLSWTVYVELIDPSRKVVMNRLIYVDKDNSSGDFQLPVNSPSGTYSVRAYTNWMRNYGEEMFFEQNINVASVTEQAFGQNNAISKINNDEAQVPVTRADMIDLQFFPEGGQLVDRITSKVAFKAINKTGASTQVMGKIVDSKGNSISNFKSTHNGMGSIYLIPKKEEQLTAIIMEVDGKKSTQKVSLPQIQSMGYVLATRVKKNGDLLIQTQASVSDDLNQCAIAVTQRGKLLTVYRINQSMRSHDFDIPSRSLKDGIVQITLFDDQLRPRCERLVFVYESSGKIKPNLSLSKSTFEKREKIELELGLVDTAGVYLGIDGSVSIVNKDHLGGYNRENNIVSHLLLTSDLKGTIERPKEYFVNYGLEQRQWLDLVMMTHGWRRYSWQDILSYQPGYPEYPVEKGISFFGGTTGWWTTNKEVQTLVTASPVALPLLSDTLTTYDNGKFFFSKYVFFDTTKFIFQAKRFNAKKNKATNATNVTVRIEGNNPPPVKPIVTMPGSLPFEAIEKNRLARLRSLQIDSAFALENRTLVLEGVTIEGEYEPEEWDEILDDTLPYGQIDMTQESGGGNMQDFIFSRPEFTRIRRLLLRKDFSRDRSRVSHANNINSPFTDGFIGGFRNINSSLGDNFVTNGVAFYWDGFPISYEDLGGIQQSELKSVFISDDFNSTIYNPRATNGAVFMYSDPSRAVPSLVKGIGSVTHPGFYAQKEFYSPNYEEPQKEHAKPDLRSTLYWNPHVYADENSQAQLTFFANDTPGTYLINIEGITSDGRPFVVSDTLTIE